MPCCVPVTWGSVPVNKKNPASFAGGKMFLVRVIIDDGVDPAVVVTVYRTTKIEKYWKNL
jgi:hypothetical protein